MQPEAETDFFPSCCLQEKNSKYKSPANIKGKAC